MGAKWFAASTIELVKLFLPNVLELLLLSTNILNALITSET